MVGRIDDSKISSGGRSRAWHLNKIIICRQPGYFSKLTYEIVFMTEEALPLDLENVWIWFVSVLSIRFFVTTDNGATGVEIWFALDAAIVNVPMIPSQNTTTPEIIVI